MASISCFSRILSADETGVGTILITEQFAVSAILKGKTVTYNKDAIRVFDGLQTLSNNDLRPT